jgi:hypothetical protein
MSPPNVISKFYHSNQSKMLSLQLLSNVVSSIAERLAFTGKHQIQCSHKSDLMKKTKTKSSATEIATKGSIVESSTKQMQNETATKMKLQKKQTQTKGRAAAISMKISGEKLMLDKLNAYAIDWTDSRVTTLETMK